MGSSWPREADGCEGANSHSQCFFSPCTVTQAHFNVRTVCFCFVFRHSCAIRDEEKESWIIRQEKLDVNTRPSPMLSI